MNDHPLDALHDWLRGYVAFPSAHSAVAVTLWAGHTYLAPRFDSTPRLAVLSPERECGKSRVLELLALTSAGAEMLSGASPAYLFRRIGTEGAGPVTLLLDEADAIWKRGKSDEAAEALRSIVDAGHRKGATVGRVEMNGQAARLVRFGVYAPGRPRRDRPPAGHDHVPVGGDPHAAPRAGADRPLLPGAGHRARGRGPGEAAGVVGAQGGQAGR